MGKGESYLESDFRARAKDKVTMKQYQECYHLKGQNNFNWLLAPLSCLGAHLGSAENLVAASKWVSHWPWASKAEVEPSWRSCSWSLTFFSSMACVFHSLIVLFSFSFFKYFCFLRGYGYMIAKNMYFAKKWSESCSVVSDSLRPHGLQPTRLLCPRDSPGKNTLEAIPFLRGSSYLKDQT